jgi:hypothetical protein
MKTKNKNTNCDLQNTSQSTKDYGMRNPLITLKNMMITKLSLELIVVALEVLAFYQTNVMALYQYDFCQQLNSVRIFQATIIFLWGWVISFETIFDFKLNDDGYSRNAS